MPVPVGKKEILSAYIYKFCELSSRGWPPQEYGALMEEVDKATDRNYNLHMFFHQLIKYLSPKILCYSAKYGPQLDYLVDHVLLEIAAWLATPKRFNFEIYKLIRKCKKKCPTHQNLKLVTRRLVLTVISISAKVDYSSPDTDTTDTDNDYYP